MYVLSYAALLAGFAVAAPPETFVLPIAITNGSTPLIYEVGKVPLDTNYITQPNATSYEWWYFDAVASDLSQHVVFQPIVDYNEDGNEPLNLRLSYSFANGSFQELIIPKEKLFVSTIGQGSAGISSDGAFSWQASPDLSQYTLTLALEDIGISGQIQLQSIAPPHVACSATYPGARLEYHWDLLWVNLLPDSVASVNLMVNGTAIAFEGSGYHDKACPTIDFKAPLKLTL
ncbi:hypothetical protein F66182_15386 [Fusarium sp. NRRL 66182]|nr:hypothetical protein F66182_15386 [Fusarium sp. NRRL 66182]